MGPTDLWRQWYETSIRLWSKATRGAQGGYVDPAGFYRSGVTTRVGCGSA